MSGVSFNDLFAEILKPKPTGTRGRIAARRECEEQGHKYQVHGSKNPTKVSCSRCEVSWAIGPRTEPTT